MKSKVKLNNLWVRTKWRSLKPESTFWSESWTTRIAWLKSWQKKRRSLKPQRRKLAILGLKSATTNKKLTSSTDDIKSPWKRKLTFTKNWSKVSKNWLKDIPNTSRMKSPWPKCKTCAIYWRSNSSKKRKSMKTFGSKTCSIWTHSCLTRLRKRSRRCKGSWRMSGLRLEWKTKNYNSWSSWLKTRRSSSRRNEKS